MDLRMPRVDGIEATRRLRERDPDVRVIALTTYADDHSVLGALRAGARGYLTKDASAQDIRAAIVSVAAGEAVLDPAIQHHIVTALAGGAAEVEATPELPDGLTPRPRRALRVRARSGRTAEVKRGPGVMHFGSSATPFYHVLVPDVERRGLAGVPSRV
jgi:DNA-binding NarL/FixJ family response regulator